MNKIKFALLVAVTTLIGCAGYAPSGPVCYATATIQHREVSVPIFKIQDIKDREYLAGAPFNGWTNKEQFHEPFLCQTPKA